MEQDPPEVGLGEAEGGVWGYVGGLPLKVTPVHPQVLSVHGEYNNTYVTIYITNNLPSVHFI